MHTAPIRTMSATALPLPSTSSYAFLFGWSGKWSSMENETASTTAYRLPSALSSRLPVTSSESERGRFVPSAFQKQHKSSAQWAEQFHLPESRAEMPTKLLHLVQRLPRQAATIPPTDRECSAHWKVFRSPAARLSFRQVLQPYRLCRVQIRFGHRRNVPALFRFAACGRVVVPA